MAPPALAAECADCHDAVVRAFAANPHAAAAHGAAAACAACHAGAAKHAESGDPADVLRFGAATPEQGAEACLRCHGRDAGQRFWRGSAHELADLSCTSCHAVHAGRPRLLASADQGATCFSCHFDVRADVTKRSAHPLRDASRTGGPAR